jgi:hypothetical protein
VSPQVLRPRLRRRIAFALLCLPVLAIGIGAAASGAWVGWIALAFALFALGNALLRLFGPRSYATELHADGFRVHDSFGRLVHDVPWNAVTRLTVFNGNGFTPGSTLLVAWRCEPRRPGHGRQPWAKGGRNFAGEEFDGALPDPYLGAKPTLNLMSSYLEAAPGRTGPPVRAGDVEAF